MAIGRKGTSIDISMEACIVKKNVFKVPGKQFQINYEYTSVTRQVSLMPCVYSMYQYKTLFAN